MWSKSATVLSKTRLRHFFRDMPYPSKTFRTPKSTREKCLETCLTRKNSPAAGFTAHVLTCFRRVLAARAHYEVRTLRRAFFQIKRERRLFRTRRFLSGQIFRLEFFIGAKSFVDIVVIGVCVLLVVRTIHLLFLRPLSLVLRNTLVQNMLYFFSVSSCPPFSVRFPFPSMTASNGMRRDLAPHPFLAPPLSSLPYFNSNLPGTLYHTYAYVRRKCSTGMTDDMIYNISGLTPALPPRMPVITEDV